jgi:hypothetical protein
MTQAELALLQSLTGGSFYREEALAKIEKQNPSVTHFLYPNKTQRT